MYEWSALFTSNRSYEEQSPKSESFLEKRIFPGKQLVVTSKVRDNHVLANARKKS